MERKYCWFYLIISRIFPTFALWSMKYSELERVLKKCGCYVYKKEGVSHPIWYSPLTGQTFRMSHHQSEEVRFGTLRNILKLAGIKL